MNIVKEYLIKLYNCDFFLQFDICERSSIKSDSNVVCLHFYLFASPMVPQKPPTNFKICLFFCIHIIYVWKNL
jgi:hypothetical protein